MMRRRHFLSLFALPAALPGAAGALTMQTIDHPLRPAPSMGGALSWDLLGQAGPERLINGRLLRVPEAVAALNGRDVVLDGFMFPVTAGELHRHFLLSGFSWHCATCATRDLTQLVEVVAATGQPFVPEAIVLRGTFTLLDDPSSRLFYRLSDARPA
jgi:hypothetical protein